MRVAGKDSIYKESMRKVASVLRMGWGWGGAGRSAIPPPATGQDQAK